MLKAYCKDFWRYRFLLQNLIGRDFKLKYRRSVLGVLWSVLNPLLMNVVMVAVFSSILDMRGAGIENFSVYLIIGQLLFSFFSEATSSCMSSMLAAAPLIKNVHSQIHLPAGKGGLRAGELPVQLHRADHRHDLYGCAAASHGDPGGLSVADAVCVQPGHRPDFGGGHGVFP